MSSNVDLNVRPGFDGLITEIAQYVSSYEIKSDLALDTARNCLIDTIGCGLLALQFPACAKMLGPIVKDTKVPFGVRLRGTDDELWFVFTVGIWQPRSCAIRFYAEVSLLAYSQAGSV